ncbi:MAG: hypothetical protein HUK20_08250 [Fibrobacter sp.]|nr:hypothetical protein [Fibrobacter sp.]
MLKKFFASIAILGCAAFAGEHWNVDAGGVSMKFLSMQVSARHAALSGAGVADPSRVSEVSRNPLAVGTAHFAEFGINQLVFDDYGADNFISAYYGFPFAFMNMPLAASMTVDFLGYNNIEGRDENGMKTSEYGSYAWSLQAGMGSRGKVFNWALTARFAQQTIDDATAMAFLGDIGGSFKVNRYLSFATVLTNFGYMGDYEGEDETAPMALQAGITGIIPAGEKWSIHLSADAYRRADTDPFWLFGGEVNYLDMIAFRAGYAIRPDTEDGISCGLGFSFGMIVFDYGYSPKPAFEGGYHYITVGLKF